MTKARNTMTKVRMLKDFPVSPTGLVTVWWKKDEEHETDSENILNALFGEGAAELVEDKAERPKLETGEAVAKPRRGRRKKANVVQS